MSVSLATMLGVGLYVLMTAPFLPLMLYVHRLGGAYSGLFMAAMVLQLVPIGLVFFPMGAVGIGLLGLALWRVGQRLAGFRQAHIDNPEVHLRWSREYVANAIALGFACEQKGAAWVVLEATRGQALWTFGAWVCPLSALLWAGLAWLVVREHRARAAMTPG
ncbi:MAG: hypothetical protein VKS61_16520 [Candidatus Sericytochromatia bacterium]|nr:hypothetical protein [Candidatus Sericytochromatia bacterium]